MGAGRAGACIPIQVGFQTSALARGSYTGTITVSDPNAVDAPQTIVVTVAVGGTQSVSITADDNVMPLITTEVKDGVLTIGSKSTLGIPVINDLRYDLTVRDLNSLQLSGAAKTLTMPCAIP